MWEVCYRGASRRCFSASQPTTHAEEETFACIQCDIASVTTSASRSRELKAIVAFDEIVVIVVDKTMNRNPTKCCEKESRKPAGTSSQAAAKSAADLEH